MGGNGLGNAGTVGNSFDYSLDGSRAHVSGALFSKVIFNEPSHSVCHWQDPALGLFAVGSTFAIDDKPSFLPLDVIFSEVSQLSHSQASVKQGEDDKLLLKGLTGIDEAVYLIIV